MNSIWAIFVTVVVVTGAVVAHERVATIAVSSAISDRDDQWGAALEAMNRQFAEDTAAAEAKIKDIEQASKESLARLSKSLQETERELEDARASRPLSADCDACRIPAWRLQRGVRDGRAAGAGENSQPTGDAAASHGAPSGADVPTLK